jgi:hypothetical protein
LPFGGLGLQALQRVHRHGIRNDLQIVEHQLEAPSARRLSKSSG